MIPVRVPADALSYVLPPVFDLAPEHPMYDQPCPACDGLLGDQPCVLVYVGAAPEDRRQPPSWMTGAARRGGGRRSSSGATTRDGLPTSCSPTQPSSPPGSPTGPCRPNRRHCPRTMTEPPVVMDVGDLVYLPSVFPPGHAGYEIDQQITGELGRVVSIEDGWAMVDRGSWGQFGCAVDDLRPAALDSRVPDPGKESGTR